MMTKRSTTPMTCIIRESRVWVWLVFDMECFCKFAECGDVRGWDLQDFRKWTVDIMEI